MDDEKKTLHKFTIRLIMEEFRWKNDDDQQASVALVTKDNNDKREQQKQISRSEYEKQGPSCFKCEEVDHLKKDCFRCLICKRKGQTSNNCFRNNQRDNSRDNWQSKNQNQDRSKVGLLGKHFNDTNGKRQYLANRLRNIGSNNGTTRMVQRLRKIRQNSKDTEVGDGTFMDACGKGNIEVETVVNVKWLVGTMHDILYVLGMKRNLFSVKFVAKRKNISTF